MPATPLRRTINLSSSDEFTTLAVEVAADGRVELTALGPLPDVFTCLRLTPEERRDLAMALLLPGEMVKGRAMGTALATRRFRLTAKSPPA